VKSSAGHLSGRTDTEIVGESGAGRGITNDGAVIDAVEIEADRLDLYEVAATGWARLVGVTLTETGEGWGLRVVGSSSYASGALYTTRTADRGGEDRAGLAR
jgi:hypothetical protein